MKKTYSLGVVIVLLGIVCWIVLRPKPRPISEQEASIEQVTNQSAKSKQTVSQMQSPNASVPNQKARSSPEVSDAVMQYVRNKMEDPKYDWKQPINFYGKIIDENDAPVSGASVDFKWNDLSEEGTSASQATSDSGGYFSLLDRKGKRLYVQVHKDGYYTSRESGVAFEYANPADGLFTPNSNSPVIFHLRKKGIGTDLLGSRNGAKPHLGVTMLLDGTPVLIDLIGQKTGQSGQLIASQKKPSYESWKQATEWSFRMQISDGGFVEQHEEFPFEAPEEGYQSIVEFHFEKGGTNWMEDVREDYYIKFGNPPRYGWLHLDTSILMNGARFTYAINPDGSRYLEPK